MVATKNDLPWDGNGLGLKGDPARPYPIKSGFGSGCVAFGVSVEFCVLNL